MEEECQAWKTRKTRKVRVKEVEMEIANKMKKIKIMQVVSV